MNKAQFLDMIRLHLRQYGIDAESSLEYYSELIDDYMEDGCTEEEAVAKMGTIEEIIAQITERQSSEEQSQNAEKSKQTGDKDKFTLKWWHKLIIILTSPIWLSLVLSLAVVAFGLGITALTLYIVAWAVIASLYAAVLSLSISVIAGIIISIAMFAGSNGIQALLMIGCTLMLAGLAVFGLIGMNAVTKLFIRFSAWVIGVGKFAHRRTA